MCIEGYSKGEDMEYDCEVESIEICSQCVFRVLCSEYFELITEIEHPVLSN